MAEEQNVVNQEVSQTEVEPTTTETEQAPIDSEVVNTQEADGKDYKTIAQNLSRALKEERERNKTVPQPVQVAQPEISDDDTVRRFLATEANAVIAVKLQTDPSFKDRVEIVQSYVAQGYTIDMADKLAKGDIMDRILNGSQPETQETPIIKQITPKAIPEQTVIQSTGNVLDDIEKGLVDVDPHVAAMLAKYRSKG